MPTNTYVALATQTVSGTSTASITFSSIPQTYTDLVLVIEGTSSGTNVDFPIRFNGDTGSNYSRTYLYGTGAATQSGRASNATSMGLPNLDTARGVSINHIFNYSNTTTFKTGIGRTSGATNYGASAIVGLWRNTAAITSLTVFSASGVEYYGNGTTLTLYGIAATSVGAKATGGDIYTDSSYYYHVFDASGTFTPTQSISADVLVVAGGGGGGGNGGGGGAGGLTYYAAQSLTATNYTCTVGAGGNFGTSSGSAGTNGTNSQFAALTASVGGGYGTTSNIIFSVGSGGSGGGGGNGNNGGTGTAGQGFSGGGSTSSPEYGNGGGGGAGAAGGAGTTTLAGGGGNGLSTYSSWGLATGIGQNISGTYWIAGGGGGAINNGTGGAGGNGGGGTGTLTLSAGRATAGLANTGGGGGGGGGSAGSPAYGGGQGGSGVIIVRYAK
jgi:hypothetical protein